MRRNPHLTQHSAEDDHPLALGVDAQGRSIHVCADCDAEIPDGVYVERTSSGQVRAWVIEGTELDAEGQPQPIRRYIHECEAPSG